MHGDDNGENCRKQATLSVYWEYFMALTLMGVRHLISPRWLEKM